MPEQPDDSSVTCTCVDPLPVERATRKGAAQRECLRCGKPIPLRLTQSRRREAGQPT